MAVTDRIERWRKLCALANDPRTPKNEAALARRMARKLHPGIEPARLHVGGRFVREEFSAQLVEWRKWSGIR